MILQYSYWSCFRFHKIAYSKSMSPWSPMTEGSAKPELRHGGVSEERVAHEALGWLVMVHLDVRLDAMSVRYAFCFDAYFHAYVRSYFHGLYMSLLYCEISDHPFYVLFRVLRGAFLFWNDFTATTLEMDLSTVQYIVSSCTCVRLFNPSMWFSWPLPLENQVCEQYPAFKEYLAFNVLGLPLYAIRLISSISRRKAEEKLSSTQCAVAWNCHPLPSSWKSLFPLHVFLRQAKRSKPSETGPYQPQNFRSRLAETVSMLKVSLTTLLFRSLQRS